MFSKARSRFPFIRTPSWRSHLAPRWLLRRRSLWSDNKTPWPNGWSTRASFQCLGLFMRFWARRMRGKKKEKWMCFLLKGHCSVIAGWVPGWGKRYSNHWRYFMCLYICESKEVRITRSYGHNPTFQSDTLTGTFPSLQVVGVWNEDLIVLHFR